ncbi:3-deoxy-D-manno-octulosonate 8-phosphate phosphatase (KDO 8-P phosphatase) [Robiginitalea myxolifaciens]|uniref:3-deoxy-D-manno-octulosonate 8-phosphate phosphatase (KDO 8-P phosphatase) n=1 Tax=Robiginitalea myxolifaciens TaxID=400055 RepID=A0A1I6H196_9FLAO|nr:HAD hydrolase family protein [Robiginitalea myxolifaciens]SFR48097.1 3-deoxy-D-manno-octulosonate 8-phosphate phosphatase (KDO 8-P phosphatase) [Robiginitalea myxolifaciens]
MNYKEKLKDVTTFVFDVDGVFTDSSILITTSGELLRKMSVRDGFAVKTAIDKGYRVCVISGGSNEGVRQRLKGLGVTDIFLGAGYKEEVLRDYILDYELKQGELLYMGDDIPDLPAMKLCGIATCPQNAAPEIKAVSDYISHFNGGQGCVRDIVEQVLKVRGDWENHFNASND